MNCPVGYQDSDETDVMLLDPLGLGGIQRSVRSALALRAAPWYSSLGVGVNI